MQKISCLFSDPVDTILAGRVLGYYNDQKRFEDSKVIGPDASMVAYFKHDWQELVNANEIDIRSVSASNRIHAADVERRLLLILERLCEGGLIRRNSMLIYRPVPHIIAGYTI